CADVGGTFTDIVLIDRLRGVTLSKLLSTPDDFGRAVVHAVSDLLPAHGVPPESVGDVVHGTTVATNTILEFKGALTGLLTTRGFRDVLELRRLRVPRLYDLFWDKPRPLVERALRLEVDERMDSTGRLLDAERVTAPLLIMQSNGGVMSDTAAAIKPAYIVESGPAAGVIASVGLARQLGIDNVITFDMGGTTAKASVVERGVPDFTSEF